MIKLVIDCTCEVSVAEAAKMGITCLPMRMMMDDEEYLAGDTIDNDTFYEKLPTLKSLPKTMAINPDDYIKAIKPLLDAGDEVFAMSISSGLSSTFNNLQIAAKELNSPKLRIFDTQTFTIAYYALVKEAQKMIEAGTTLDELEKRLTELRGKVQIYTIVDDISYMVKGGRISVVKALLVKTLHIKPIIGVVDKKLAMVAKGMGYNNAKKQMLRLVANADRNLPLYYGHAHAPAQAEDFKQIFDFNFVENREIGPIIGTHGGPGCVGLAFFEK